MVDRLQNQTVAAVSGAIVLMCAGSAVAEGQADGTYRVRASVPVACWVRPTGTLLAGTGRGGSVVEACNSPGGFTVSASYRPLGLTEKAHMLYGDSKLDLAKSGQQVLRHSNIATIRTVDYRFEEVTLDAPLVLFLTIQPI